MPCLLRGPHDVLPDSTGTSSNGNFHRFSRKVAEFPCSDFMPSLLLRSMKSPASIEKSRRLQITELCFSSSNPILSQRPRERPPPCHKGGEGKEHKVA